MFKETPSLRQYYTRNFTSRRYGRRILLCALLLGTGVWVAQGWWSSSDGRKAVAEQGAAEPTGPARKLVQGTIQSGDTLGSLLGQILSPRQVHDLTLQCREVFPVTRICTGRPYKLSLLDDSFESFVYEINQDDQLLITQDENGFSVSREPIPYTVHVSTMRGTIESSLFESVVKAGGSDALAVRLGNIFAYDIDFIRDIQPGDSFEIVVEKRFREDRPAGLGRLLAARFNNNGQVYNAFYFEDGDKPGAYYDQNGRSLRKAFLKAPLSFTRISSGFNLRRRHPILNTVRPHPAIDYAAPTGTPIMTIGEGTVMAATYNRFNGNYVRVRHPGGWETLYNHMSRFGNGIRTGSRVRQGQVIGYVGSTGLSTGPHLDFRMYKNGTAVNPLTVKMPPTEPVSKANLAAFRAVVAEQVARLEGREVPQVARLHTERASPLRSTDGLN
jgi:murein DD-endopeptidase MepM/ murein hydrolase activator NlpD